MLNLARTVCLAFALLMVTAVDASAQANKPPPAVAGAIAQAQQLRALADPNVAPLAAPAPAPAPVPAPPAAPSIQTSTDPSGQSGTLLTSSQPAPANNAFFQSLGSNGRSCNSCHLQTSGWTITPSQIQALYTSSAGTAPLFRRIDGATCPTADVSSAAALQTAYALLLNRGLLRVGVSMPATADFTIAKVVDPYNCTTSPTTGLLSPSSGVVSVYRRPLPTANLRFETSIMWDGREPSFTQQASDATLIHAQAFTAPTAAQLTQIVGFELAVTAAQASDNAAGALNGLAASGGPAALAQQAITGAANSPAPSAAFTLFGPWSTLTGADPATQARSSIARGQAIFNNRPINIAGVNGFNNATVNGVAVGATLRGACSSCHNVVNAGDNNAGLMLDIGVTGAAPPALNVTGLPQFTLQCANGTRPVVTDPGVALISGKCADVGKTKVPSLRNLAARSPFFHNGAATQLQDVVGFYDARFRLGLTAQEKADLVNFLAAL